MHGLLSPTLSLTQYCPSEAGYCGMKPALISWLEGGALGRLQGDMFSGEYGNSLLCSGPRFGVDHHGHF